jgi:hypothetical protein
MASSYLPRFAAISVAGDLPGHNRLPVWLGENEKSYLFIALGNISSTLITLEYYSVSGV